MCDGEGDLGCDMDPPLAGCVPWARESFRECEVEELDE